LDFDGTLDGQMHNITVTSPSLF